MLVAKINKNHNEGHKFVVVIHAESDPMDIQDIMSYTNPEHILDFIQEQKAKKVFFQNQEVAETFLKDAMK